MRPSWLSASKSMSRRLFSHRLKNAFFRVRASRDMGAL